MIALLFLLVVVVAAAGLLASGVLASDRRGERPALLALLAAPVVVVVGILVLAALFVGVRGMGSQEEGERPLVGPTTTTAAPIRSLPSARLESAAPALPVVVIRVADDDRFSAYQPLSGLAPGSVVRVQAEGFGWFERGHIELCVTELGHETACAEPFPVQFDDDGRADFQFAVRGDVAPGGCRAGQPTCLLRLSGNETKRGGSVQVVLVDRLAPAEVHVEPARGLEDGRTVDVSVTGFPAGTATAVLCAPPEPYDARRCSPPRPESTFVVDAAGAGRTTLVVAAGRLGPDGALCGPRRLCGLAVVAGVGFVTAPVAPVRFSLGPGVAYEAGRAVPGVAIAVVLVGIALTIARRTDWTKPTEAATPELDQSDLRADQDLDDLFGTDEEIDSRDPISW